MIDSFTQHQIEALVQPQARQRARAFVDALDNDWSLLETLLEALQEMDVEHLGPLDLYFYKEFVVALESLQIR